MKIVRSTLCADSVLWFSPPIDPLVAERLGCASICVCLYTERSRSRNRMSDRLPFDCKQVQICVFVPLSTIA